MVDAVVGHVIARLQVDDRHALAMTEGVLVEAAMAAVVVVGVIAPIRLADIVAIAPVTVVAVVVMVVVLVLRVAAIPRRYRSRAWSNRPSFSSV